MARRKMITTAEDVAAALEELGGSNCSFAAEKRLFRSASPGYRYESVEWGGYLKIKEGDQTVVEVCVTCVPSAKDLYLTIRAKLIDELAAQAQRRKVEQRQPRLDANAKRISARPVRRLEYHPLEKS